MSNPSKSRRRVVSACAAGLLLAACGARTGLYDGHPASDETDDASVVPDAGKDNAADVVPDSSTEPDTSQDPDVSTEPDVSSEADVGHEPDSADEPDVSNEPDVPAEADVNQEPDVHDAPDTYKPDCTDPSIKYVYVVTEASHIYSFRPGTLAFKFIGTLDCPSSSMPFSMAVDRKGIAHVVFFDGGLFRVNLVNAHCEATPWIPGSQGFQQFGMGFSTDEGGPSEKLYIANSGFETAPTPRLGWLDTTTYQVHPVGLLADTGVELTGTGDGRLYGFFQGTGTGVAHLAHLDKTTAVYKSDTLLPGVTLGLAWAFAFWGGDFWFFTAPVDHSTVTWFDPDTSQIGVIAELPNELIVGAGVSTCAPEQW